MAVGQATAKGAGGGAAWKVLAAPLQPRTWTATVYLLLSMAVGTFWQVVLVTGFAVGLGTLVVWAASSSWH